MPPKDLPDENPYHVLNLPIGSSEKAILKQFRQLARSVHPDKLHDASPDAIAAAQVQFQRYKTARDFLVNDKSRKERLDAHWKSQEKLLHVQRAKEQVESARRKRMRQELEQAEQRSNHHRTAKKPDTSSLQKESQRLKEEYARARATRDEAQLRNRQVRLKWSRKKLASSPSEASIANMLTKYGTVTEVLFIGSKGNLALVTFSNDEPTVKVVEAYRTSDTWRATFIGDRKHREASPPPSASPAQQHSRDQESVQDWKARRDAERAKLLAKEESNGVEYPLDFPDDYVGTMQEKLTRAEKEVIFDLLSNEQRAHLQSV